MIMCGGGGETLELGTEAKANQRTGGSVGPANPELPPDSRFDAPG